ncbi:hypothetical protein [Marinoscillum furvescens]|uniref:Uncharacterized protein n=1 Tax=Marinoscillum furvescens DSM 4134 TaxID=1122208 RepID=A0A3D9L319_MARFU|nr:hypothetical protein [Marinoscillum furvescens]RED97051.1 hypothetical protein C7460_113100 [Marinoscillum furvescens DSM 4134]
MTFFDQIYERLFPSKQAEGVVMQELIKRKDSYLEDYNRWKNSYKKTDMVQAVADSYRLKLDRMVGEPDVHILNTSLSNGFAISYHEHLGVTEFKFLFDWLAEKVQQLNYKKANADITITEKKDFVETKEKYYFKPRQLKNETEELRQYFGNILIEHIVIDKRPSYIKLTANTYSDRQYQKPDSFELLAKYLFENT